MIYDRHTFDLISVDKDIFWWPEFNHKITKWYWHGGKASILKPRSFQKGQSKYLKFDGQISHRLGHTRDGQIQTGPLFWFPRSSRAVGHEMR